MASDGVRQRRFRVIFAVENPKKETNSRLLQLLFRAGLVAAFSAILIFGIEIVICFVCKSSFAGQLPAGISLALRARIMIYN